MEEMAAKMRIPKDERTGVYEQHAGYFDLPHVDLQHFPPSRSRFIRIGPTSRSFGTTWSSSRTC